MFIKKGGKPIRETPHYMVIGECPWLATWFEDSDYIKIPIQEFERIGEKHVSDKIRRGKR